MHWWGAKVPSKQISIRKICNFFDRTLGSNMMQNFDTEVELPWYHQLLDRIWCRFWCRTLSKCQYQHGSLTFISSFTSNFTPFEPNVDTKFVTFSKWHFNWMWRRIRHKVEFRKVMSTKWRVLNVDKRVDLCIKCALRAMSCWKSDGYCVSTFSRRDGDGWTSILYLWT